MILQLFYNNSSSNKILRIQKKTRNLVLIMAIWIIKILIIILEDIQVKKDSIKRAVKRVILSKPTNLKLLNKMDKNSKHII